MDTKVQRSKKPGPPEIKLPVCTALMSLPVSFIGGFSSLLVTCIYAVFVAPAIFLISIPGFIARPFQLIAYCTILSPLVLGFYFGIFWYWDTLLHWHMLSSQYRSLSSLVAATFSGGYHLMKGFQRNHGLVCG